MSGSGISWAICKSALRSRQITTPTPHHSVFLQAGCPSCRPTNSVKALKAQYRPKPRSKFVCFFLFLVHGQFSGDLEQIHTLDGPGGSLQEDHVTAPSILASYYTIGWPSLNCSHGTGPCATADTCWLFILFFNAWVPLVTLITD